MSATHQEAGVRELVIVGRDAPVWLAACVMQYALGPAGVGITVVELPSRAQPADVCVSLPALEPLHTRLRIDEARLVAATRGAFTLGRHFVDGAGRAPAFFHAHGSIGSRIDQKEFLPHWLLARRRGLAVGLDDMSLTAVAARHGRMLLPDSELEGFGFTDYGYHLPAIPYGAWLRQLAIHRGARVHASHGVAVRLQESGAEIAAVLLEDGRQIAGDFFLDVTGGEALLAGAALGVARESWRDDFPVSRVLTAHAPPLPPVPIYSEIRAGATGWVGLVASQACTHVLHAFDGDASAEQALASAERAAGIKLDGAAIRGSDPGRRSRAWEHNCVAIGAAACELDPLHWLDLQAVQVGLVHLLPLFPVTREYAVERAEYNQNVRAAFERMRDFQSAHYLLNRYGDSPFWTKARTAAPSAALAHKIDVFRARGAAAQYEDETFDIHDWQALLVGHGVIPETYDPAVERTSPELVQSEFARLLGFIRDKVSEQVSHTDYLQTVCAPANRGPALQ